jgi:drug/metabolite transporter (DMT)-like permease
MRLAGGLVLALLSAGALNWGWVVQHAAAATMPPLSLRRPLRSLRLLFRDLSWLAGFLVGLAGWGLYIGALALAPLSLVQAVSAGGLPLLAVLARRRGAVLDRRRWTAVGLAVGGLLLLALSLVHGSSASHHASWRAVALWVGVSAVLALGSAGSGALLAGGAGLGVASGILYAAGDVATKAAVGGTLWLVFAAALLAAHGGAFACLQLGFQRGDALATAGTATLLTNLVPIVAGLVLFGDALPGGALGVARVVSFAAVVAGAALLATGAAPWQDAPDGSRGGARGDRAGARADGRGLVRPERA